MTGSIGILGGMGPMATCDLMGKIIQSTDAKNDQEHIHIYVDCNTNIPDRTAAILHQGADPLPEMIKSANRLQEMGADVLIMPCNTAHYFIDSIQKTVTVPILNMLKETAACLQKQGITKAAVLATDGTVQCGLYDNALQAFGIEPLHPKAEEQALIMHLIYDCVKAGKPCPHPEKIIALSQRLIQDGAQALILGCTELPIAFSQIGAQLPTIDPTQVLAEAAIRYVGGSVK